MSQTTPTTPTHVLMVDDDPKLCGLVKDYLEPLGYAIEATHTGPDGVEAARKGCFDAVILDVMLPGMDGFEVLREIRRESADLPVLMLTGRGEEADRVMGLELGADDYLPKTFSTRELLARLRAVTRRSSRQPAHDNEGELINGDLRLRAEARAASIGDKPLRLTALEFDLLVSLLHNAGRVRSREQLLNDVAGRNYDVFDRSIDVHMSSLRRKLGDNPREPRFIRTIRGVGYMMQKH
ncbi:MAG: DNA-binding response regulator [Verrucomicrobiales bacterium]|nr:DNA-binding response regulator [Verrucomicrobiales bacterium]MBL68627.1 DNA-binding response regulator [Verrucomicrobiales bacterium]